MSESDPSPAAFQWRLRGGTFPPRDDPWSYVDYHHGLLIQQHPEKYEVRPLYAATAFEQTEEGNKK